MIAYSRAVRPGSVYGERGVIMIGGPGSAPPARAAAGGSSHHFVEQVCTRCGVDAEDGRNLPCTLAA